MFVRPQPFVEAIAKLGARHPVTSRLTSEQWREVPVALRERAFFSSRVESARFLEAARSALNDFLAGARETLPNGDTVLKVGSRADFIKQMQDFATASGLGDALPGQGGDLDSRRITNIRSAGRLGLIFDTQIQAAHDYGYWKQGMDADVLDAFPAQKFIRVIAVKEPRLDHAPFEDRVALKTDLPFWVKINRDFGVPWGPWGWRCGHDVEDVGREEAEALGLLKPGQKIQPVDAPFNRALEASTRGLGDKALRWLGESFGDQVYIDGDTIRWKTASVESPLPPGPRPVLRPAPRVGRPHPGLGLAADPSLATAEEAAIVNRPSERALIYGPDGAFIRHRDARPESPLRVELTAGEIALVRRGFLSHNHPSGAAFSLRDAIFAMDNDLLELRAIARSYDGRPRLFRLIRPAQGWQLQGRGFEDLARSLVAPARRSARSWARSLSLPSRAAEARFSAEMFVLLRDAAPGIILFEEHVL